MEPEIKDILARVKTGMTNAEDAYKLEVLISVLLRETTVTQNMFKTLLEALSARWG